jgi:hypothetical protein
MAERMTRNPRPATRPDTGCTRFRPRSTWIRPRFGPLTRMTNYGFFPAIRDAYQHQRERF